MNAEAPNARSRFGRLREALTRRDWLGLGIEIVVVTLGVLLAFQIDQWGERRARAAEELLFLGRISDELKESRSELEQAIRAQQKVIDEVGFAIRSRSRPATLEAISRRMDFGCGLATLRAAAFNDTAWQEMVSSGRLNLVSDEELRALMRKLIASQAQGAAQVDYGRQTLTYNMPNLDHFYTLYVDEKNAPICFINWPRLVEEPRALTSATRLLRRHIAVSEDRQKTLALTVEAEKLIACKLRRRDCRQR